MSRRCKYCGSYNTHVNYPTDKNADTAIFEENDGKMLEDIIVPYHCEVCGYEWYEIIRGEKENGLD